MEIKADSTMKKKGTGFRLKNVMGYVKTYAQNCRFSFNNMLNQ